MAMKTTTKPNVDVQLANLDDLRNLAIKNNAQVFEYCTPTSRWEYFISAGKVFGCYVSK